MARTGIARWKCEVGFARALGFAAALGCSTLSGAEEPERRPPWSERILYGGQLSGTFAKKDPGYFNRLDYLSSALRLFRASLLLEVRPTSRFAILGEVRSDNLERVEIYALYARFRPFRERAIHLQAGRIPPVVGAFARRRYDLDNPLIGYPLVYQYPTIVRPDAAAPTYEELFSMRGRGAKTRYSVGNPGVASGLPVVNPLRWDTGVQARFGTRPVAVSAAVTQGTLSSPRVRDDNSGLQLSARVRLEPVTGLVLGASYARGRYDGPELREALRELSAERSLYQTTAGVDFEFARGPLLLRGESLWTRWDGAPLSISHASVGTFAEARYKLFPGFYAAGRGDYLGFSRVGGDGERRRWDAPVVRLEAGVGYQVHRHLLGKVSYQHNRRDGGPVRSDSFVAVQAVLWF